MIKKINKKGAEKILSVYWFAILVITAGAVIAMVGIFYNSPYDVREIEANLMINKVSDCLSENGRLNEKLFSEGKFNENFNLLDNCGLIFDVEKDLYDQQGNYYVEINFYALDSEEPVLEITHGNFAFKADCEVADEEKNYKRLVKCSERNFYSLDYADKVYNLKILSIIRKTEKNVR